MSDLIIKPSAGAGNKLILQDQAGGAILTTAESGAVIANTSVAGTDLTGNSLGVTAANDTAATLFIKADNSDDAGDDLYSLEQLRISKEQVEENFRRFRRVACAGENSPGWQERRDSGRGH